MSLWFTIPLGVAIIAVIVAVIKRGTSRVTTLHIDH
jgi:hypothetical protein